MKPGRPTAVITIDGRDLTAAEAALVELRVELSAGAHDSARLVLWNESKFASAKAGSEVAIAIGTVEDSEEDVFTGQIVSVARHPVGVSIDALGMTAVLSRTRRSETYVGQTIGDILQDLAGTVDVDEVESDTALDAYSLDHRRTVWSHVLELARIAGCEVSTSPSGGLRFVPPREGSARSSLRYGANVLGWEVEASSALEPLVAVSSGSASQAGAEKWHWLQRDPASSASGSTRVIGSFRTTAAADSLSEAWAAQAGRAAMRGRLTLVGDPLQRPGDTVTVEDLPGGDPGNLRVRAVRHTLGGRGFLTELDVEAAGGSSLPGLPI